MAKVTVASTGTQILNGAQTVNTLIVVGSTAIRMATGVVGARTYDDMAPLGAGQRIIIPPSITVTLYCKAGEDAPVWTEGFGV